MFYLCCDAIWSVFFFFFFHLPVQYAFDPGWQPCLGDNSFLLSDGQDWSKRTKGVKQKYQESEAMKNFLKVTDCVSSESYCIYWIILLIRQYVEGGDASSFPTPQKLGLDQKNSTSFYFAFRKHIYTRGLQLNKGCPKSGSMIYMKEFEEFCYSRTIFLLKGRTKQAKAVRGFLK